MNRPSRMRVVWLAAALLSCLLSGCSSFGTWWKSDSSAPGAPNSKKLSAKEKEEAATKSNLAIARLAERRDQIDQAEKLYGEVLEKHPDNAEAHHRLAVIYSRKAKFKEAEEHFTRARQLTPDNGELLSDLGYHYYLCHRLQEAEECLRHASEIDPTNTKYSNNLALVVGEMGRDEECLALFRRAGSRTQADVNFAFVLAQRGEYQRALDVYDHALTEDRSMRVAAEAMIELSHYTRPPSTTPQTPGPRPNGPMMAAAPPQYPPGGPQGYPPGYPPAMPPQPPAFARPGQPIPPSAPQVAQVNRGVAPSPYINDGPQQATQYVPAMPDGRQVTLGPAAPAPSGIVTWNQYPGVVPSNGPSAYPTTQMPNGVPAMACRPNTTMAPTPPPPPNLPTWSQYPGDFRPTPAEPYPTTAIQPQPSAIPYPDSPHYVR
jgi:Flp pilus assembly protein TadD